MSQNTPPDTMDKKNLTIESINPIDDGAFTETIVRNDAWYTFQTPLIWKNIIAIIGFHLIALYGLLTWSPFKYKLLTLWVIFLGRVAGFGVTGGAHRFWTHRSYKANLPLRIILMTAYLLAGQNTMFDWVRDHRIHHKYSESDADPHDSRRGFFFSHVGWLMMRKHPEVLRRGQQIDMSDVLSDPVVQFSQKYFIPLKLLICFVLPIVIPVYLWNENWYPTIISQVVRYVLVLNFTWSVNSFAHLWGYRSYDKLIAPAENGWVAWASGGEGWHNYHHVFPWDYKAAELVSYWKNPTTTYIDIFAKIGWAYDLRSASDDLVRKVTEKRGDGSHPIYDHVANETSHEKHH